MNNTNTLPRRSAAPMRILRQLLFRQRANHGNTIELEITDRQITREESLVRIAGGEARVIETRLQCARQTLRLCLTDRVTPGVIDATESRQLARILNTASVTAHAHIESLEAMT